MDEPVIRINIDVKALRRAFPPPEPSKIGQRLEEAGRAAAPVIQKAFEAAFATLNRLRR